MKFKRILAICMAVGVTLALALGAGTATAAPGQAPREAETQTGAAGAANVTEKDEVVYARLGADGAVSSVYAVNHFEMAGAGEITDYGNYESVQNLTDTGAVTQNGDTVTATAGGENFYYQGDMAAADLPWIFDFTYYLDGKETAPQDMGGKTGAMELKVTSRQNTAVDPTFYDNYMLQITVTLDTEKCGNIVAEGGTAANAGKSKTIAYTVMPGSDADFTLKADVRDFTMTGVQVAGIPYSMDVDIPDMDEKMGDLEQLPDAIAQLNDGVGDLKDGTGDMKDGAAKLAAGSSGIKSGLDLLSSNSGQLVSASSQINSALGTVAGMLDADALAKMDFSQLAQLPGGLNQIAQGLRGLSTGLADLKTGYSPAFTALDGAITAIPAGTVTQDQINALYGVVVDPDQQAVLNELVGGYTAAQTVRGTYAQVKPAFEAVVPTIDTMVPSLDAMAATLETTATGLSGAVGQLSSLSQLSQLAAGLSQLSASYSSFHAGLSNYMSGVSSMASGYGTFNEGVQSFNSGVGDLDNGVGDLHEGTNTLNDEVANLPEQLQNEIDNMKDQYLPADFAPVSFTSAKNTDTVFVQFVMQADGVELPDAPEVEQQETVPQTFWDRLVALFTGKAE